jgi:hypothetical protein
MRLLMDGSSCGVHGSFADVELALMSRRHARRIASVLTGSIPQMTASTARRCSARSASSVALNVCEVFAAVRLLIVMDPFFFCFW